MSASDWALLVVLSTFWGGSFFFTALTVREIPPLTGALGRVAIAGAALFVVVLALRQSMARTAELWRPVAEMKMGLMRVVGLVAAVGVHFWTDIVWHVVWPLINN